MKRNERARQVLSRFGDVAWFRHPVERHPFYGYLQVSFVAWRYVDPREELKKVFETAVQEAPERVEWTFRSVRNWMIVPSRLMREAGPDGANFNDAMGAIRESDQEFCAATAEDLENTLRKLAEAPSIDGSPSA
ncbi:hypothetical protein [Streptomyces sp. NPDC090132]|uniref:hypothetical protein n=1 Tax=Streptomyces sp. NPDC090132 TaxID=3365955 RepID=UPI00382D502E